MNENFEFQVKPGNSEYNPHNPKNLFLLKSFCKH